MSSWTRSPWSSWTLLAVYGYGLRVGRGLDSFGFIRGGCEVSQVLFRLSRWEIWNMPRKFDQDAKDRVVRLVEDRILAENMSMQAACQAVAPKLGVSWHTARQWT